VLTRTPVLPSVRYSMSFPPYGCVWRPC